MRLRLWPRSLAGRTALVVLAGLVFVQGVGLAIHALDRVDVQRLAQMRQMADRLRGLYRTVILTPPGQREVVVRDYDLPGFLTASLDAFPAAGEGQPVAPNAMQLLRADLGGLGLPPPLRPRELLFTVGDRPGRFALSARLPDMSWLNVRANLPPPRPWHSNTFLAAFAVMTIAAAVLVVWAARRLTRPVRVLAEAADRLGRDVNATPLPTDGPSEISRAAHAFNTMAERIRRFVQDRTTMLAAVGHDLRTPITRLKLRAEFVEDEEMRRKMLNDLDEMEGMVAAVMAFARDDAANEPAGHVDLAALARTVVDEASDMRPDLADRIAYAGPEHLRVSARPAALKRALTNLVGNALNYGGSARVTLDPRRPGLVQLFVDDDGPGIPDGALDRVFQPFFRLEGSRNRETGGTGLGLPIARNMLRAHGGDVQLQNRPEGGLRAVVTLPA
jgi:hypothetical protein